MKHFILKAIGAIGGLLVFYLCVAFVAWDLIPPFGDVEPVVRIFTLVFAVIFALAGIIAVKEIKELSK